MNRDVVKWDDLRVFLEVARHGSVHAAAKRLNLDHSTVCRRIGKLENLLSVKLLDRTQRGIVLRDGVQDVLRHIEHMETHANSLEDAIVGTRTATQIVRIATMEGIASRYIARRIPLLERFAAGRSVAQGSRHLPELLQSAPAGPLEQEDRRVRAVLVLLGGICARAWAPAQPCRPGQSRLRRLH
jgi:DNA-binding transcriptional LysR family regulator